MKILIMHSGTPCECFIASSLLQGFKKIDYKYPEVFVVVNDKECESIFEHNTRVKKVYVHDKIPNEIFKITFDKVIVLHPGVEKDFIESIESSEKSGFHCSEDSEYYFDIMYGRKKTKMNLFQIYYKMSGMKWHGQRYDFNYFPKSRSKENRTGIAVANANLRNYIINRLHLDESNLWVIPYKNSIFKKMDEINKCKRIITDDFFTLNIAVYLKKSMYFLKTLPYTTRIEMFGNGYIYNVPTTIVK